MQEYIFSYRLQSIKLPGGATLIPGTGMKEVQSQGKGWEGEVTVNPEEDTSNLILPKTMTDIHLFLHYKVYFETFFSFLSFSALFPVAMCFYCH